VRIVICDDDKSIRDSIKTILSKSDDFHADDIHEASSGEELILKHKSNPFTIILLDIEMEGMTGMEAGHEIRNIDKDVIIVFITSHQQYVFSSFKIEAFDYIVKPINEEKINEVLDRAARKYRDRHHIISYKWQGTTHNLDICEIVHIVAYHNRILFYTTENIGNDNMTKENIRECNGSLDKYERDLLNYGFMRCHRNTLVNMRYIKSIEEKAIVTLYNERLTISIRKKQHCLRAYNSYLTKYRV